MDLQQATDGYLVHSQVENKTPNTIADIRWNLKRFREWKGDVPLDGITTADLRQYLLIHQRRGLSGYSIYDIYKVLRAFLRWSLREQLITRNPIDLISPPKLPQLLPKVLEQEQVEKLLDSLKKVRTPLGRRNLLIVMTFLDCGLRVSELAQLQVGDVRLEESYITIMHGKGQKQRVVPVSPVLRRYLWRYMAEWRAKLRPRTDGLFVGKGGNILQTIAVQHLIRRALASIGVRGGPHLLRHTCATLYLRNGGDLERLRLILGHSDFSVIQRYVHLVPDDLIHRHQEIGPLTNLRI